MRRSTKRKGFSLLEMIAAVVILAVVAVATTATIVPMRAKSQAKIDTQNIAKLQAICDTYYLEQGTWPDKNLTYLERHGYAEQRYHETPYGGRYTFNASTKKVENLNAPQP
jgi:prepilin-type N-terminal cleavage/methylation domain-containing protein